MRAELKSIFVHFPGEPVITDGVQTGWRIPPPEEFAPADAGYFGYHAQIFIGTDDSEGCDSFDVVVCTPRWLVDNFKTKTLSRYKRYESENLLYGTKLLLMETWDPVELRASIESICSDTVGPNWHVMGNSIGRWLPWELQYRYDREAGIERISLPPKSPQTHRANEPKPPDTDPADDSN